MTKILRGTCAHPGATVTDHFWHFCRIVDGRPVLRDDSPAADPGHTERYDGSLVMCERGLHASRRAIDAIENAPGPWVRLVTLGGKTLHDATKSVAAEGRTQRRPGIHAPGPTGGGLMTRTRADIWSERIAIGLVWWAMLYIATAIVRSL